MSLNPCYTTLIEPIDPTQEKPIAPVDSTLQEKLDSYKAQLEEFQVETHPDLIDPDKLAEAARDSLIKSLPIAVTVLHDLLVNPKPETRMSAAKFIVNATLNKTLPRDGETLAEMFEKLGAVEQKEKEKVAVAV